MKLRLTEITAAAALTLASTGALAAADNFTGGNFTVYDSADGVAENFNDILFT